MSSNRLQHGIPAPILATHGLSVHYGNRPALEDISLSIEAGDVVGVLGPNGSGKSTLLKVFAGMIPPSHGSCSFNGREITAPTPGITYV
ncbi:MAG: ATP-binding cassette domain-containing protein, partial [Thermomicrobiales bacterium]